MNLGLNRRLRLYSPKCVERPSNTEGFAAAAATPRSEGLGGGIRISRGGVVDAFTRDLELMEVIVAADAVVKARVDLEDAEDWLARAFS
jgi:hypothetical protein